MSNERDVGFTLPGRTLTTGAHLAVVMDRLPAADMEVVAEYLRALIEGNGGPSVSQRAMREALMEFSREFFDKDAL